MLSPRLWIAPGARFQPEASKRAKASAGEVCSASVVASRPAPVGAAMIVWVLLCLTGTMFGLARWLQDRLDRQWRIGAQNGGLS